MARKRKSANGKIRYSKPKEQESNGIISRSKDARKALERIDDIEFDAEDEFHAGRDRILLDGSSKYREDEEDLVSEEEVFGLEGLEDEDDEEDDDGEEEISVGEEENDDDDATRPASKFEHYSSDESDGDDDDLNAPLKSWGRNKRMYYDADQIEDSDDAKEEEAEALRLQKEALESMTDEDFIDEEAVKRWKDVGKDGAPVAPDEIKLEIPEGLSRNQIIDWLETNASELLDLIEDFDEKSSLLTNVKAELDSAKMKRIAPSKLKYLKTKYAVLSNYLINIAFLFSLRAGGDNTQTHPIMSTIDQFKKAFDKLEGINLDLTEKEAEIAIDSGASESDIGDEISLSSAQVENKTKKRKPKTLTAPAIEYEELFVSRKASKKTRRAMDDDFGDPTALEDVDAEEKASRKRSLRFYAARIDQKSLKRSNKAATGGDDDIPYRDRDRAEHERQLRAREQKKALDLDDEDLTEQDKKIARSIVQDQENADGVVEDEDGYYDLIKSRGMAAKNAKKEAYEASKKKDFIEEDTVDGKRAINYQIAKNKGLTPKRRKEVRNPRVKKRMKFDKAKKKLSSIRAVFKEDRGGNYGGEATGIKANVVKSIRF